MKKIGKVLIRIVRNILLFFDKWLITPLTKLILKIMKLFIGLTKDFDKVSGKKSTLLIISLANLITINMITNNNSIGQIDAIAL